MDNKWKVTILIDERRATIMRRIRQQYNFHASSQCVCYALDHHYLNMGLIEKQKEEIEALKNHIESIQSSCFAA